MSRWAKPNRADCDDARLENETKKVSDSRSLLFFSRRSDSVTAMNTPTDTLEALTRSIPHIFKGHGPWVMQDAETRREWLFPETPRFYIHLTDEGKWCVVDRWQDLVVGEEHSTRSGAVRAFYKLVERPVTEGTNLPSFKGSNYKGA